MLAILIQLWGLMGDIHVNVDAPFITACAAALVALGATVRTWVRDKKTDEHLATVADKAAEEVVKVSGETKSTLDQAAANVTSGVTFLQSVLDQHRAQVNQRMDADRAVWIGGLAKINRQLDDLSGGHDTLLSLLATMDTRLASVEERLPNRGNSRKTSVVADPSSVTTVTTVRK